MGEGFLKLIYDEKYLLSIHQKKILITLKKF